MTANNKIIVTDEDRNKRLDVWLAEKLLISRSQVQKLIERDLILVNGKLPKKAGDRVKSGEEIEFTKKDLQIFGSSDLEKRKIKRSTFVPSSGRGKDPKIVVVCETKDYVVVNKPAGMLVHPTEAHEQETLIDYLVKKYPEIKKVGESSQRPGIVHRLDKEASGLLVIARTPKMFKHLKKQFQDRTMEKEYSVLVYEQVIPDHDKIDFDIDRGSEGRMVSRPNTDRLSLRKVNMVQPGKVASTEFFVEKRFARFTLLRVRIHTGRTHQIRVHLLAYNHPVVGDTLYINKHWIKKTEKKLNRLFLHATKLCFNDLKEEKVCFEAKLPKELVEYLKKLK